AIAFFSGKKSVPVITIVLMNTVGLLLSFIWTYFVGLFTNYSTIFLSHVVSLFIAAGEYLFISFIYHHLWNTLFRFTEAGGTYVIDGKTYVGVVPAMTEILFNHGTQSEYWSMMPKLTRFMAQQQMLVVMFLFPAIALAMYKTAYKENKAYVRSMLVTMVLTAFLG